MLYLRLLLLIAVGGYLLSTAQPKAMPRLLIDQSVAPDFRALMQETWWQFLGFFATRSDCFGDLRVVAVKELVDRARYDPATATMLVRVPERGSLLQAALVHEWAHHVEFRCAAQVEMRAAFLQAQGLAPDTPWYAAAGSVNLPPYQWARIPSEQFAETVAALVVEKPGLRTVVPITAEGMQVVWAWARQEQLPFLKIR
jgi:hypothetical protein